MCQVHVSINHSHDKRAESMSLGYYCGVLFLMKKIIKKADDNLRGKNSCNITHLISKYSSSYPNAKIILCHTIQEGNLIKIESPDSLIGTWSGFLKEFLLPAPFLQTSLFLHQKRRQTDWCDWWIIKAKLSKPVPVGYMHFSPIPRCSGEFCPVGEACGCSALSMITEGWSINKALGHRSRSACFIPYLFVYCAFNNKSKLEKRRNGCDLLAPENSKSEGQLWREDNGFGSMWVKQEVTFSEWKCPEGSWRCGTGVSG